MQNIQEKNKLFMLLLIISILSCTSNDKLLTSLQEGHNISIGITNNIGDSKFIIIQKNEDYIISFNSYYSLIVDTTFILSEEKIILYQKLIDSIFNGNLHPNLNTNCCGWNRVRIDLQKSTGLKVKKLKEIRFYGCFDLNIFFEKILNAVPNDIGLYLSPASIPLDTCENINKLIRMPIDSVFQPKSK